MRSKTSALLAIMAAALLSLNIAAEVYGSSATLTGTVVSLNHDLNYVTVRDDVTGRTFKLDTRNMNARRSIDVWNLRAGDRVTATGVWEGNDTYRADRVMFANGPALSESANSLTGTVEDVNRDLHYITIRNQATGGTVNVDVRGMDTRRSVNVWQLHQGDLVTTQGRWENNGTWRADFVNFGGSAPMASGYVSPNSLTGVVENVNRGLNYFTMRDDVTGRSVKVDVRGMDTRRSINVWRLRAGDRISIDGSWNPNGDRFEAETVRF